MRVAIYTGEAHPDGPGKGAGIYRSGRIQDVHHPVTNEVITKEDIAEAYLKEAKAKFPAPGFHVVLQHIVHNADGSIHWVNDQPEEEAAPGQVHEENFSVEQTTASAVSS